MKPGIDKANEFQFFTLWHVIYLSPEKLHICHSIQPFMFGWKICQKVRKLTFCFELRFGMPIFHFCLNCLVLLRCSFDHVDEQVVLGLNRSRGVAQTNLWPPSKLENSENSVERSWQHALGSDDDRRHR